VKQFTYMQQISNSRGGKKGGYGEHENVYIYMFGAKVLLLYAVTS
jgi:hypothetical protein